MTYGVLGSAILGLGQFVNEGSDHRGNSIVFQINDGGWGEMVLDMSEYSIQRQDPACMRITRAKKNYYADVIEGYVPDRR